MLSIDEGDIDRNTGVVTVRDTKEGDPKTFPLISAHLDLVDQLPLAFAPNMPFSVMTGTGGTQKPGGRFSRQMIWAALKRACARHKIYDVDLYGFTRHSLLTAMRQSRSFKDVKTMSGHTTNKALARYIVDETSVEKSLYELADNLINVDNGVITQKRDIPNS